MSIRRSPSTPPTRAPKRQRLNPGLTPEDYKNGVMLAPMVRSGAMPTRLFALKHGAKLVWGPELIDKAILHAERTVDPATGVVTFKGTGKPMFTTHPLEKPYLIYQIGSADPQLAVQAAKKVMDDVSGIDLNCGCPKPFSTHAGMGAALLSTPDLLCDILRALRQELPPEISVSAKIRLLPSQEDTIKLVERIIGTGVNALTVHCRTRNQRMGERAVIERLREIVEFVERGGSGIAVIANGDCKGFEDAKRVKEVTGAHSVMIATAAESNPTVFSPTPLVDLERTLIPAYIRMCRHLDHHWASAAWSFRQFNGAHQALSKREVKTLREAMRVSKRYEDMEDFVDGKWNGEEVFTEIEQAIARREDDAPFLSVTAGDAAELPSAARPQTEPRTPPEPRPNPEPVSGSKAPWVSDRPPVPAAVSGRDELTPTPMVSTASTARTAVAV